MTRINESSGGDNSEFFKVSDLPESIGMVGKVARASLSSETPRKEAQDRLKATAHTLVSLASANVGGDPFAVKAKVIDLLSQERLGLATDDRPIFARDLNVELHEHTVAEIKKLKSELAKNSGPDHVKLSQIEKAPKNMQLLLKGMDSIVDSVADSRDVAKTYCVLNATKNLMGWMNSIYGLSPKEQTAALKKLEAELTLLSTAEKGRDFEHINGKADLETRRNNLIVQLRVASDAAPNHFARVHDENIKTVLETTSIEDIEKVEKQFAKATKNLRAS
jgi:hypothetical protein